MSKLLRKSITVNFVTLSKILKYKVRLINSDNKSSLLFLFWIELEGVKVKAKVINI